MEESLPAQDRVQARRDGLAWREVGDEVVILDLESSQYLSLNASGAQLWKLIEQPTTVADLIRALVSEYEIEDEEAERDVFEFLESCRASKLLQPDL